MTRSPAPPIPVELAITDDELGEHILALVAADGGVRVRDASDARPAQVRITDAIDAADEGVPLLVLCETVDAADALRAGAAGVLLIDTDADALLAAIRAVSAGLTVLAPEFRSAVVNSGDAPEGFAREGEAAPIDLTPRELQVLSLLAQGASNKAIARQLDITAHTAKFHVASIVAKLDASGRTDAVAKAIRMGLMMV